MMMSEYWRSEQAIDGGGRQRRDRRGVGGWRQAKGWVLGVLKEDGEANGSEWTDGGGDDKIDEDPPPSPPTTASSATAAWIVEMMTAVTAEVAMAVVTMTIVAKMATTKTTSTPPPPATTEPSPPWQIHPSRPSPVSPVGGGGRVAAAAMTTRTTWRRCTGGGWTSAMPTPTAPMRWWGVVIEKLIPLLFSVDIIIFTSTKSKHSDSPRCEPITPLFLEEIG